MTKYVDTVVTFANIPSTASHRQAAHGFNVAADGSDVLLVVESHMRRDSEFLDGSWVTSQKAGHQTGRCSVSLKEARFDIRSVSNPLLNRANGMSFPGATRYGQVVRSKDQRTGRFFNWGSFHVVPHADIATRPGVLTRMPRGRANVIPAIQSIIRVLPKGMYGQEVWGADVNVDLDNDMRIRDFGMYERFRRAGFVSDVGVLGRVPDTHGRNEYDWIMGRLSSPAVRFVHHSTLPKLPGLDHRFRRVTIRSTVRQGYPG